MSNLIVGSNLDKINVLPTTLYPINPSTPPILTTESYFLTIICKNYYYIFLVNTLILLITGICLSCFSYLSYTHQTNQPYIFWLNQLSKYIIITLIQYFSSLLAKNYKIKVNYTRKIVHISYFIWPQILDKLLIKYDKTIYTELWNIWIILFLLLLMSYPIRKRCSLFKTLFISVDRPEDQPYTLIWFSSQIIVTLIILLPFIYYFNRIDQTNLVFIPILINGLGDGLAEPVGVRFGKHIYKTQGCLSNRVYQRSYEGSACVYLVSILVISGYYHYLTKNQLIFSMITIPICSTLAEAYSPHTWDSPCIYLTVLILLVVTLQI